ncbi:GYDIA family GHMP kinase [uncultured Algibacter sp.]|uniref:GYDIA family GHMP kinase n=1 Tax=uncultured Algibacter sp. TaxID=298659 RepID=UPI002634909E|nr:GYDIA family GHMP kinase [uncultured Algibacter sp.]
MLYRSNGKLLLTGEYAVLDGALSLAIPTKFGQSLKVETIEDPKIIWESLDEKGLVWFESSISINEITTLQLRLVQAKQSVPNNDVSNRLIQILSTVKALNPNFLNKKNGYKVTTKLDFPRTWGLGTSSTLINNIAQWAKVDAYKLLELTFGGSGYDIACAKHNMPISYQLLSKDDFAKRNIKEVDFRPSFKEHIFFVYLNRKQNSRDGIKHYHANKENSKSAITEIDSITNQITSCNSLAIFEDLITKHENIIGKLTKQKPIKDLFFNDFEGGIKSLGAWGGDFILVTSKANPASYFKNKGYNTIIPYKDMVL